MKFHLPKKLFVAVLAAVMTTQVYAEENAPADNSPQIKFGSSDSTDAVVTITGGDFSEFNMYGNYQHNPVAKNCVGGAATAEKNKNGGALEKIFTSATVYMSDGTLGSLIGQGIPGSVVTGDTSIYVSGGTIDYIKGGTDYPSNYNRNTDGRGIQYAGNDYGYKSTYNAPEAKKQNINIYVSGGNIGQIRGGHNGKHADYVIKVCKAAEQNGTYKALMENKPWSVSGDVNISITNGTIDPRVIKRSIAILGAGGSGHSVDGTVFITIDEESEQGSDIAAETRIYGDIIAGGSNAYAEVGATSVSINGGSIEGSIYGGGYRDEAITQKDGKGAIAPAVLGSTSITLSGGTVTGSVYGAGIADKVCEGTNVTISNEGSDISGTIYGGGTQNEYKVDASVAGARTLTVDSSYTGDKSYKVADFTDIQVNADVTMAEMTAATDGTAVKIAEGKTLTVAKGENASGATSVSGGTLCLDGSEFELTGPESTLTSNVVMKNGAELNLNGAKVDSAIYVYGCTLSGGGNYEGDLVVDGGNLTLTDQTCAQSVTITNGGTITGSDLATDKLTVDTTDSAAGAPAVQTNLTIHDGGEIVLTGGGKLVVTGSLTLGNNASVTLVGDYEHGDEVIELTNGGMQYGEGVMITFGDVTLKVEGDSLVMQALFDQDYADTVTLANWGIATASRAFVNTIRGQRTNTGCIANGRGTAWAAVLGGNHDIAGADIDLKGAAVGADMKVGETGSVGIAVGYIDGDARPNGLPEVDQNGTYVALYGEHGLKKLSATSCLSLDWVAAYGSTDSDVADSGWEQDSLQLNTRLNWNKKLNSRTCMSVFGGLEYFATNSATVDEVKTGSIQNLRGEIGMSARYVACGTPDVYDGKGGLISKGCEKLVLHGEVRYMNDMVRKNPVVRMYGLNGTGENPGYYGVGIEAGATYRIDERWSASANYGFNTMEDSREHRVNVGASYTF